MDNRGRLFFEFLLIVVGVLVALTVESWFESRRDDAMRVEYLSRLVDDVSADIATLKQRMLFFTAVQEIGNKTLAWIASGEQPTKEALTDAFFAAEVWPFEPNESTYLDLQSTGNIRLLEDLELRMALSAYYAGVRQRRDGWNLPEDYRALIRGLVPPDVQGRIRRECPSTDEIGQRSRLGDCELSIDDSDGFAPALTMLRADRQAARLLTYRMSEVEIAVFLYESQLELARQLVAAIENRLREG